MGSDAHFAQRSSAALAALSSVPSQPHAAPDARAAAPQATGSSWRGQKLFHGGNLSTRPKPGGNLPSRAKLPSARKGALPSLCPPKNDGHLLFPRSRSHLRAGRRGSAAAPPPAQPARLCVPADAAPTSPGRLSAGNEEKKTLRREERTKEAARYPPARPVPARPQHTRGSVPAPPERAAGRAGARRAGGGSAAESPLGRPRPRAPRCLCCQERGEEERGGDCERKGEKSAERKREGRGRAARGAAVCPEAGAERCAASIRAERSGTGCCTRGAPGLIAGGSQTCRGR